jgi:hypothetical protein
MAGQPGFFDVEERLAGLSRKGDELERLAAVVDFELFRAELERAVPRGGSGERRRPPFDHVLMFKVLILQTQNNLSDERTEFFLRDRLTWMRFLGLGLGDPVPDANTIWTFREALTKAGAIEPLFALFDQALRAAGYLAMSGQLVARRARGRVARLGTPTPQHHEDRKQAQAAPAAGADEVAFFPLTVPFTAGPGTIAVAIALGASGPTHALDSLPHFAGGSLAAVAVAVTIGGCYAAADRVVTLLGPAGARVVTRLTAFLLLCIGVQIVLTGVQDALVPLLARRP